MASSGAGGGGVAVVFWGAVALFAALTWQSMVRRASRIEPWPTELPLPLPKSAWPKAEKLQMLLERVGEGELPHPEDLAPVSESVSSSSSSSSSALGGDGGGDALFAACSDGWIKQVSHLGSRSATVLNWTKLPGNGRPLGLAPGLNGELIACEPSLGLLNVTQGKVSVLTDNVCGSKFKFTDGVDVSRDDGVIYFTDASTKFGYGQSDLDVLEGRPNGRLLKYDPSTKATSVLATDLFFPNGVALASDQTFLVFCETSKVRCQKLWLRGERKGEMEIFIDNLPGYPDNIRSTPRGTFWIGLVAGRSIWQETLFSVAFFKHLYTTPKRQHELNVALRKMAKVLEVSNEGKPLRYFEDATGASIGYVTTALEIGDYLYLGGLASTYIGKLKL